MSDQVNVTQSSGATPPPPVNQESPGPAVWVILGVVVGALVVLLLIWAFWLQPSYFPTVTFLTVPQTVQAPAPAAPAPNVNVQGGTGQGGTGGTGQGGTGGTGGTGSGGTGSGGTGSGGTGSGTGAGTGSTAATTAP